MISTAFVSRLLKVELLVNSAVRTEVERKYGGAAPLITEKTVLGYAARILAAESEHVGAIRMPYYLVPEGPLKNPAAIKTLFEGVISECEAWLLVTMHLRSIDGDHAYILWSAETADNYYEFATDTFVVRNGKIIAQSFAAKIKAND